MYRYNDRFTEGPALAIQEAIYALVDMYEPELLIKLPTVLAENAGKEQQLLDFFTEKYNNNNNNNNNTTTGTNNNHSSSAAVVQYTKTE